MIRLKHCANDDDKTNKRTKKGNEE